MTIKVLIPTPLQKFTDNQGVIESNGATIADLIDTLETNYPGIKARLCDEKGMPRRFLNFYVGGEDIRLLDNISTPLKDGDEISIVPAVSGG